MLWVTSRHLLHGAREELCLGSACPGAFHWRGVEESATPRRVGGAEVPCPPVDKL